MSKMPIGVETLHERFRALLSGMAAAALVVGILFVALPSQSAHDESMDYGYVYSGAKASSVEFVRANLHDDSLLMLGSSEFSTPKSSVPQIPAEVFGTHNFGVKPMCVGEAFDQCLWDAIAIGAFADGGLSRNKVVLTVGLGQFTDGGMDASTFSTRFSYTLYQAFCANQSVSAEARKYVAERLSELGIDDTTLRAASPSTPIDVINGIAFSLKDDLKIRNELRDVRDQAIPMADGSVEIADWDALRAWGLKDAVHMSTNNEWGAEDKFYSTKLGPALDGLEGARAAETYTDTAEYDDLSCFLDICDACGIEPLVVISPSMGPYYDYIGITRSTRESAYQKIRDVIASHPNASLADFSDKEYEKYFLFDIVHFGWTGWIDVEHAIYDFAVK